MTFAECQGAPPDPKMPTLGWAAAGVPPQPAPVFRVSSQPTAVVPRMRPKSPSTIPLPAPLSCTALTFSGKSAWTFWLCPPGSRIRGGSCAHCKGQRGTACPSGGCWARQLSCCLPMTTAAIAAWKGYECDPLITVWKS